MSATSASGLHTLDDVTRERLKKLVAEHGLAGAARILGVSRGVVASAAGGIGVRRGSVELVREALADLDRAAVGGARK